MEPKKFETVEEWGGRVLNGFVLDKLIAPALQGIYGAKSRKISAKLSVGKLFLKTRKDKSKGSLSFKNGMNELQEKLRSYLKENGVGFFKEPEGNYDHSVVSTPAHSLPNCVSHENQKALKKIEYKKVSTMTLFIDEIDKMDFTGFGVV